MKISKENHMQAPVLEVSGGNNKFFSQALMLAVLFFCALSIFGQQNEKTYLKLDKPYVLSYFDDALDVAIAPTKWKKQEWLGFAAFTGASLLVYSQEEEIRDFFQRNRSSGIDQSTKYFLDPMGKWCLAGFLGGMYIYGLATKNQNTETAALLTGKAVVITGAYTLLFKNLFQRQRPLHGEVADHSVWGGPLDGFSNNSFPSGHASVSFAAATVLSAYYRDHLWVGITAFSLASLVAVSRVYDDKHWASDVLAGAALGYAIGSLVYNKHKNAHLKVLPYQSRMGTGVSLTYRW